jgi:hypothetical protein
MATGMVGVGGRWGGWWVPCAIAIAGCDPDSREPDDGVASDTDAEDTDAEDTDVEDTDPGYSDPNIPDTDGDVDVEDVRIDPTPLCPGRTAEGAECTLDDGSAGHSYCIIVDDIALETPCLPPQSCTPGEGFDQGCLGDACVWNGESFEYQSWSTPDCNTPLVLDFGDGIDFAPATANAFDLSRDGSCQSTDWPTAPWLALDRDGDGLIRGGGELFGNATAMATGGFADHGFAALAELDSNRDGKITAADREFGKLMLWQDLDDDRIGGLGELLPLSSSSLVSIDLGFRRRATCDAAGNCGLERASFEFRGPGGRTSTGEIVDVHLPCR